MKSKIRANLSRQVLLFVGLLMSVTAVCFALDSEIDANELKEMQMLERLGIQTTIASRFSFLFSRSEINSIKNEMTRAGMSNTDFELTDAEDFDIKRQMADFFGTSQVSGRLYHRIGDRVFSRTQLPNPYRNDDVRRSKSYCGHYISCLKELPYLPKFMKKRKFSSSYTIYTPTGPQRGTRLEFKPLVHYQLVDVKRQPLTETAPERDLNARLEKRQRIDATKNVPLKTKVTLDNWHSASAVTGSEVYPLDLSAIEASGFDSRLNTRIIIGGYLSVEDQQWMDELVRIWKELEPESNIIKVSWSEANSGFYNGAAYSSRFAGRQLTVLLHYLKEMFGLDLDKIHIVGHSLGAHIAGVVGDDHKGQIARITGLDPAGPRFRHDDLSMRLDKSDAKFVDIIHTNAGLISKFELGTTLPSGHIDYYPNGGTSQPGCESKGKGISTVVCNHGRSYEYFCEILRMHLDRRDTDNRRTPHAFLMDLSQEDSIDGDQVKVLNIELTTPACLSAIKAKEAPKTIPIEFHSLQPDFPTDISAAYYFLTRSEYPYFGARQYSIRFETVGWTERPVEVVFNIKKKIIKKYKTLGLSGNFSFVFVPQEENLLDLDEVEKSLEMSVWWNSGPIDFLLSKNKEWHVKNIQLLNLEPDEDIEEPETITFRLEEPNKDFSVGPWQPKVIKNLEDVPLMRKMPYILKGYEDDICPA